VRLRDADVRIKTFPVAKGLGRRAGSWGLSQSLALWIRQNYRDFDLIHCHGAWQMVTLLSAMGSDAKSPKLILSPHESMTTFDIGQSSSAATGLIKAWLRRYYAQRVDLFIMSSRLEANTSLPQGVRDSDHVAIIPHPVFDDAAQMPITGANRAPSQTFKLGYLGRLHAKKNVHVILQALHQTPDPISLTVAGDGSELESLKSRATALGLDGRINWRGFVQGQDKAAFFDDIDVLVMPSEFECFGMAAAEAMAHGVPVLVGPDTGIAEIVRDHGGGEIVTAEAGPLQTAIEQLSKDPEKMAKYSRNALCAAHQALSFEAFGSAMMQQYEKILAMRQAA
jgi:glycosyltransferase involved in cell wall biosynthesis